MSRKTPGKVFGKMPCPGREKETGAGAQILASIWGKISPQNCPPDRRQRQSGKPGQSPRARALSHACLLQQVDELNPTVFGCKRILTIFEAFFAITNGQQPFFVNVKMLLQIMLDRKRTPT